ncbi:amino acid ABC transporter permease [Pelomicrobium methylotrophicum]|uniref:Glutamate/aspartate import permease protein GltK n=1 Tax=Pelomicrobium methylotrophicum TaxID=2602750 RepID=A0A5C7EMT2_9PROT|nr:amino acid ABC transporter permease [Pelomicrobium methylotrophicum]TXF12836.1 amino acid ABC transporter permease [Pelomicrobium methylotrophicum]
MLGDFDFQVIVRALPFLWQGMKFSLYLTLLAMAGGIVLGTLLALMRLSRFKVLSMPAGAYVNLLRSIPLILVIFWFYFLVPVVMRAIQGTDYAEGIGPFYSALIAFTLFEAAYYCEIIRAGIQSVPKGQIYAAYAMGLSYSQAMRYVVLPQAFRNMVPILLTQGIILFQDTSLVYVVGLSDFMGVASKVAQRDGRLVELYTFAAVVYFAMCYAASHLVRRLQQRFAV